jgi:hypothetical protein
MRTSANKITNADDLDFSGHYSSVPVRAPTAVVTVGNDVRRRDFAAEAGSAVNLVEPSEFPAYKSFIQSFELNATENYTHLTAPNIKVAPDPAQEYFMSTQEWDGYVTEIAGDEIEAVIYPIGDSDGLRQDAVTIPLSLVDDDARARVKIGSIFRLATGRLRRKRQNMHGVKIYFRLAADTKPKQLLSVSDLEGFFVE